MPRVPRFQIPVVPQSGLKARPDPRADGGADGSASLGCERTGGPQGSQAAGKRHRCTDGTSPLTSGTAPADDQIGRQQPGTALGGGACGHVSPPPPQRRECLRHHAAFIALGINSRPRCAHVPNDFPSRTFARSIGQRLGAIIDYRISHALCASISSSPAS